MCLSLSSCNGDLFSINQQNLYSTISATSSVVANGSDISTITITLLDLKKMPMVGIVPQIIATGSNNSYTACSITDSTGGSSCSFSSTKAETKSVTMTFPFFKDAGNVAFIAGAASSSKSSITGTSPVLADGVETSEVTITLLDSFENPVQGIIPTFSATDWESTNVMSLCSPTDVSGNSFCTLASTEGETKVLSILSPVVKTGDNIVFTEMDFCNGNTSNAPFAFGDGSALTPYGICTAAQLNNIGVDPLYLDKKFKLYANLDLASYTANSFQLIGSLAAPFTGTFDGRRKIVTNFTFSDAAQDYVGLFRRIGGAGIVKNLGMTSVTVLGNNFVGPLVGENTGIVSKCYAKGGSSSGSTRVGGLIGRFWETDASSGVDNSYAEMNVTGADFVGGLIGWLRGTITSNYAKGTVNATQDRIGGLVGTVDIGSVINSYTESTITGRNYVGGVVGIIDGYVSGSHSLSTITCTSYCGGVVGVTTSVAKKISTSYAEATITSTANFVGGLVGYAGTGYTVENSYAKFTSNSATSDRVGGLVGYAAGPVLNVYAIPLLIGGVGTYRGGIAGRTFGITIVGGLWNNEYDLTIPNSTGASTTTVMHTAQTYIDAGWSSSIWNLVDGSYPTLK